MATAVRPETPALQEVNVAAEAVAAAARVRRVTLSTAMMDSAVPPGLPALALVNVARAAVVVAAVVHVRLVTLSTAMTDSAARPVVPALEEASVVLALVEAVAPVLPLTHLIATTGIAAHLAPPAFLAVDVRQVAPTVAHARPAILWTVTTATVVVLARHAWLVVCVKGAARVAHAQQAIQLTATTATAVGLAKPVCPAACVKAIATVAVVV